MKAHECVAVGSTRSAEGWINKILGRCATAFIVGDPLFYNIFCGPPTLHPPSPRRPCFEERREKAARLLPVALFSSETASHPALKIQLKAGGGVDGSDGRSREPGAAWRRALHVICFLAENERPFQLVPLRRVKGTDAVCPRIEFVWVSIFLPRWWFF